MNDSKQLLELLYSRDESALSLISSRYGPLLRSLAHRLLGSSEDAEECLNDVLLEIWNTIPPASPTSLASYACMLTRRTAIDKVRHYTAEKRGGGEYLASLDELSEVLSDDGEVSTDELREVLNEFLANLSPDDRTLFMGRYWGAEPLGVLAARQGLSRNAVALRLSRIREKLKQYLTKRGITV